MSLVVSECFIHSFIQSSFFNFFLYLPTAPMFSSPICSICYRVVSRDISHLITLSPCGHTICMECANQTIQIRPACPTCQKSLSKFPPTITPLWEIIKITGEKKINNALYYKVLFQDTTHEGSELNLLKRGIKSKTPISNSTTFQVRWNIMWVPTNLVPLKLIETWNTIFRQKWIATVENKRQKSLRRSKKAASQHKPFWCDDVNARFQY